MSESYRKIYNSWALALAFGIVAQIGGHVRTQNPQWPNQSNCNRNSSGNNSENEPDSNESNSNSTSNSNFNPSYMSAVTDGKLRKDCELIDGTAYSNLCGKAGKKTQNVCQARPLGSRLLGPLVLFCDWLKVKPELRLQSVKIDSNEKKTESYSPKNVEYKMLDIASIQEKARRFEFWEVVCHLANTLPDVKENNYSEISCQLREHIELEGYTPFEDILFTLDKNFSVMKNFNKDENANSNPQDDNSGTIRIKALKSFCTYMSTSEDNTKDMNLLIVKDSTSDLYFTAIDGASKADSNAKPNVLKQVPMQSTEDNNGGRGKIPLAKSSSARFRSDIDRHMARYRYHEDAKMLHGQNMLKHTRSWHLPPQYDVRDPSAHLKFAESPIWSQNGYFRRDEMMSMTPKVRDTGYFYKSNEESDFPSAYPPQPLKTMRKYSGYDLNQTTAYPHPQEVHPTNLFRARSQPDVFSGSYAERVPLGPTKAGKHRISVSNSNLQHGHDLRTPDIYNSSSTPTPLASWNSGFLSAPGHSSLDFDSNTTKITGSLDSGFGSIFSSANSAFTAADRQHRLNEMIYANSEETLVETIRPPYTFNFESTGSKIITLSSDMEEDGDIKASIPSTDPKYEQASNDLKQIATRERFKALSISPEDSNLRGDKSSSYSHYQMFSSPYPLNQTPNSTALDNDTPKTVFDRFHI